MSVKIKKALSQPGNLRVALGDDEDPDYWQSHLEGWRKSGLSQAKYCRHHNLKYINFRKWKEQLSTYPTSSSIKLVEVRRDFNLKPGSGVGEDSNNNYNNYNNYNDSSPSGINMMGGGVRNPSGIRFWYGEFCIEVDVEFSSESLSQLIGTLRPLRQLRALQGLQVTNPNPNPNSNPNLNREEAGNGNGNE